MRGPCASRAHRACSDHGRIAFTSQREGFRAQRIETVIVPAIAFQSVERGVEIGKHAQRTLTLSGGEQQPGSDHRR